MTDEIKVLKLMSGEEIIAEVRETQGCYIATSPLRLFMQQGHDTQGKQQINLVLIDYMTQYISDDEFVFSKDSVMHVSNPTQSLITNYKMQFSKIIQPEKSAIIT